MSEYTPTTDEVRVAWAGWTNAFGRGLGIGKDEFDRWLAAHDAELEAENERLRDAARNYEIAMHGARGERDSALAEVERLWVNLDEARGYTKKALAERDAAREQVRELEAENERLRTALRRKENHRARARERARQRDEVIERVRAILTREHIPGEDWYEDSARVADAIAALDGDGR